MKLYVDVPIIIREKNRQHYIKKNMVSVNNQTSENLYIYFITRIGSTSTVVGSLQPPSVVLKTINGVPQPIIIKKNTKYNFHGPYNILIAGKKLSDSHVLNNIASNASSVPMRPIVESFGTYKLTSGDQIVYYNGTGNDITVGSGTELTKAIMWSFMGIAIALFVVLIAVIVIHFTSHAKAAKDDMKLSASLANTISNSHASS